MLLLTLLAASRPSISLNERITDDFTVLSEKNVPKGPCPKLCRTCAPTVPHEVIPPIRCGFSSFLEVQEVWQIVLLANPVLNQLRALLGLLQFGNWE